MVNDTSEYKFKCLDCGWTIPAEEIKQKTGYKEQIFFCEQCGATLTKWMENELGEQITIEQEPTTSEKLFPVEIIATDPDFTAEFIDELTLVLARMIYANLRMIEQDRNVHVECLEFDATLLDYIADTIMPVLEQEINPLFLKKLKSPSLDQFNSNMNTLHEKLAKIPIYRQNFIIYYRWLIREVFFLVTERWNEPNPERFDKIILNDLKHYEFDEIYASIKKTIINEITGIIEFDKDIEKFSKIINSQIENLDQFEQFLRFTHGYSFLKDFISNFNKSGNWIKNLAPTKRFIENLKTKQQQLSGSHQNPNSLNPNSQENILSQYIALVTMIKEQNVLAKSIKALLSEKKGDFNAYDLQRWLFLSDTSARNQLKKLFPDEKYEEFVRTQTHITIDSVIEIVQKKGGKCHTKTINNAKSRLHLECAEGHHFYPTYDSIVYQETWCPNCHIYIGESICRKFFELIFKRSFPKSYPPWLVNGLGNQLELDGYCNELNLAFEYQGIQHRKKAFGFTDEDVKKLQQEDAYKLQKCKEHGVLLLQIPDDEIVPYDAMQDYIIKLYEQLTEQILDKIPLFDYRGFTIYENRHAKKFREYVEKKGGTLITPYFSAKKEVKIMCEHGHEWSTTPNSVSRDNWCSVCAGNIKGSSDEFRRIGKKFKCKLISEYLNSKMALKYECPEGHKFTKDPFWLKHNYRKIKILCPKCQTEFYAGKFRTFVSKKGGFLLTPYKGRFSPVKIKCKNNHEWKTTPGAVYQGNWCKECQKKISA